MVAIAAPYRHSGLGLVAEHNLVATQTIKDSAWLEMVADARPVEPPRWTTASAQSTTLAKLALPQHITLHDLTRYSSAVALPRDSEQNMAHCIHPQEIHAVAQDQRIALQSLDQST
jgi:hypothetical protein